MSSGILADETLAYHAARILVLILRAGKRQGQARGAPPGVEGRTLLAKLDFFLRYPMFLRRAATILKKPVSAGSAIEDQQADTGSVESRTIRYLYGPWDHIYYLVLAYFIGKDLINVGWIRRTEVFRLTDRGTQAATELATADEYSDLATRAADVYRLFYNYSGTGLKEFIYNYFPDVVSKEIGETI